MSRETFWTLIATLAVALAGCFAAAAVLAAAASAAEPYEPPTEIVTDPAFPESLGVCPASAGEGFPGEDPLGKELRSLRYEVGGSCDALADRLEELSHRTFWLTAEARDAGVQRATTNEKLTAIAGLLAAPVAVKVSAGQKGEAVDVAGAAGGEVDTAEIIEAIDASGEASRKALWFIAGALVTSIVGYAMWRSWAIRS